MSKPSSNINDLKHYFVQPGKTEDACEIVVDSITKYFNRLKELGSEKSVILGTWESGDYSSSRLSKIPLESMPEEKVMDAILGLIPGSVDWGHPLNIMAPAPPPTLMSLFAIFVTNHLAPNLMSDRFSQRFAQIEIEASSMIANLVGYETTKSMGFSTYGGAGTVLYGIKLGIEKVRNATGVDMKNVCVFKSEKAHISSQIATRWLGIDHENLIEVPSLGQHINYSELLSSLRKAINNGFVIGAIIAEVGSTYDFSSDDVSEIAQICDQIQLEYNLSYKPHIHADAVIGWIFSVFNDYSFEENPLNLSSDILNDLQKIVHFTMGLSKADSLGVDFHKLAYSPLTSSMFIAKDGNELRLISRSDSFSIQSLYSEYGNYNPEFTTLECTRPATGIVSAYVNCLLFGKRGYQKILAHNLDMASYFRKKLQNLSFCKVLNDEWHGPAIIFRLYQYDNEENFSDKSQVENTNDFNKTIYTSIMTTYHDIVSAQFSRVDNYDQRTYPNKETISIGALKCYFVSPFIDEHILDDTFNCIKLAHERLTASQ